MEVPCIVQWRLLRYSAPTSLNKNLLNDGCMLEVYNKVIDVAMEASVHILFSQTGAQKLVMMTEMNKWEWRPAGADVQLDLLLGHEDDDFGFGADKERDLFCGILTASRFRLRVRKWAGDRLPPRRRFTEGEEDSLC